MKDSYAHSLLYVLRKCLYQVRVKGKALKKRSRVLYYGSQWLLLALMLSVLVWI